MAERTRKFPLLYDEAWVREHYVDKGLSGPDIAQLLGCSAGNVELALRRFNIEARSRHYGRWKDKKCQQCGTSFTPNGPAALFCSNECRAGRRKCLVCGDDFDVPPRDPHRPPSTQKYCSTECRGKAISTSLVNRHERNRSGQPTRDSSTGYVRLYYGARNNGGYRVMEHRQVVEDFLGRPLLPSETVHHINGDTLDNRIENLQVRQGRHGKGVVYRCNSCGSHDVGSVEIAQG